MQSVRDMGSGSDAEQADVEDWLLSDSFSVCCEIASWNPDWIRDLLNSIKILHGSVRKPVTKKCLEMLRTLIRITNGECQIDRVQFITGRSYLDSPPVDMLEKDIDVRVSQSKLSKASRRVWEKKRNAANQ